MQKKRYEEEEYAKMKSEKHFDVNKTYSKDTKL